MALKSQLKKVKCPKCGGTKTSYSYVKKVICKCSLCNGNGKVEVLCAIKSGKYEL